MSSMQKVAVLLSYVFQVGGAVFMFAGLRSKYNEQVELNKDAKANPEKHEGVLTMPGDANAFVSGNNESYLSFILRQIWSFAYIGIGYILAAFTGGGKLCCCEILIMLGLIAAFVWIPNKLIPIYIKKRYSGSK